MTATGFIWVRYSFVITPVNYSLAAVRFMPIFTHTKFTHVPSGQLFRGVSWSEPVGTYRSVRFVCLTTEACHWHYPQIQVQPEVNTDYCLNFFYSNHDNRFSHLQHYDAWYAAAFLIHPYWPLCRLVESMQISLFRRFEYGISLPALSATSAVLRSLQRSWPSVYLRMSVILACHKIKSGAWCMRRQAFTWLSLDVSCYLEEAADQAQAIKVVGTQERGLRTFSSIRSGHLAGNLLSRIGCTVSN